MRLHRFYNRGKIGKHTRITIDSAELVNQVRRVFRLKAGDSIIVFDGSGNDYECAIAGFEDSRILLHVASVKKSRFEPARKIYLVQALIKKDLFEGIVQSATELGVTDIVPVLAERSEKKSLDMPRLLRILVEASEQSGRGNIPVIHPIADLESAIGEIKGNTRKNLLAFHTEAEVFNKNSLKNEENTALFIGPEGGWAPRELVLFHENGVSIASLGLQTLRSETAAIAALSLAIL